MDNKNLELEECRQQVQNLIQQANELSEKIDRIAGMSCPASKEVIAQSTIDGNCSPIPISNGSVNNINNTGDLISRANARNIKQSKLSNRVEKIKSSGDLENKIGKNIFAILASLLVLIGVGVFISTFYEMIPNVVKIVAIYLLGFALLGVGINRYNVGKNNFWLGVASCGVAELLVSIVTSHTYFGVISLPVAYIMIIVWIIGSFFLTKYHPTVFKTIGYIGFIISTILGLSLLGDNDGGIYLSLLGSFVVLSIFFIMSNKECVVLNTAIAFASTIGLSMFVDLRFYISVIGYNIVCVVIPTLIVCVQYLYLKKANLSLRAYPFFSCISLITSLQFISYFNEFVSIPFNMIAIVGLWYVNFKKVNNRNARIHYSVFSILFLLFTTISAGEELKVWLLLFAATSYALYILTNCRDIAWIGFFGFVEFCMISGNEMITSTLLLLFSIVLFIVLHSKISRNDSTLQISWYICCLVLFNNWLNELKGVFIDNGCDIWTVRQTIDGIFYFMLSIINTVYLHMTATDEHWKIKINFNNIIVLIVQGVVLGHCLDTAATDIWYLTIIGIVSSLLIVSYGLLHNIKTKWENKFLTVWQFAKFTIYCIVILSILDMPSVIVHIALLILSIGAIIFGFKLCYKSVRAYGLVLSILDVASLVLFNVDYDDSLQFAGGIILCGALCFVISFIYSKISKTMGNSDQNEIVENANTTT